MSETKQKIEPKTESQEFAALERRIKLSRSFLLALMAVVMAALPIFQFFSGYVKRSELQSVKRSICILEKRVFCAQHRIAKCDTSLCDSPPNSKRTGSR